jgi:hypothetical protein
MRVRPQGCVSLCYLLPEAAWDVVRPPWWWNRGCVGTLGRIPSPSISTMDRPEEIRSTVASNVVSLDGGKKRERKKIPLLRAVLVG